MRLTNAPERAEDAKPVAWALSLAGWTPFLFLALVLLVGGRDGVWGSLALDALLTYAAVIASFLGGTRWGAALFERSARASRRDLVLSVVPALVAWAALFAPEPVGLAVMALVFAAQGAWDAFSAQDRGGLSEHASHLPRWFGRLRVTLTLLVVAALVVALIAIA